MKRNAKRRWFWAWLIQMTVPKDGQFSNASSCEVWENLIVVTANNPITAVRKAYRIGKGDSGDCRGTLKLFGRPAVTKFLGIADIGVIYDDLVDGAEILWRLRRCKLKKAKTLVLPKSDLLLRLNRDLANVD